MIEREDYVFATMLRRMVVAEINGDGEKNRGLLYSLYTAQDWEGVLHTKGKIFAYDRVLEMMDEIMRRLNDEPEPRPIQTTMRPN